MVIFAFKKAAEGWISGRHFAHLLEHCLSLAGFSIYQENPFCVTQGQYGGSLQGTRQGQGRAGCAHVAAFPASPQCSCGVSLPGSWGSCRWYPHHPPCALYLPGLPGGAVACRAIWSAAIRATFCPISSAACARTPAPEPLTRSGSMLLMS